MVRRLIVYSVLVFSYTLFGQNPFVELDIEPKTVEVGQPFSVTIKTNIDGDIEMNMPDEFIQSGPRQSGMSTSMEVVRGKKKMVRFSFQSFTGYFDQEGEYTFGPIQVKAKRKTHASAPQTVKVIKQKSMMSEDPAKNLNKMMFGVIQQSKKEVYEGEAVVLEGKLYSQVDVLQLEDYQPFSIESSQDMRSLGNSDRVVTNHEVVSGKNLMTLKIGKSVLFPGKVGEIKVKPFQTVIIYNDPRSIFPERAKVVSSGSTIRVKPLPSGAPREFIGAVGEFKVTSRIKNPNITQGEVIELLVKIEGHGNLHDIQPPPLKLPAGLKLYGDPEVKDDFSFCSIGTEGTKTFNYFIRVEEAGKVQIPPIKIAYFNPKLEAYEFSQCNVVAINAEKGEDEVDGEQNLMEEEIIVADMQPFLATPESSTVKNVEWLNGWGKSVLLSPILLGLIAGCVVRVKKNNEEKGFSAKQKEMQKSSAVDALSAIDENLSNDDQAIALSKVLIDYLAQHFAMEKGEITRLNLQKKVPHELEDATYAKIKDVFDQLEAMKYGALLDNAKIKFLKEEVTQIIEELA